MSIHGAFTYDEDEVPIRIMYDYPKDHRVDLKQFVVSMVNSRGLSVFNCLLLLIIRMRLLKLMQTTHPTERYILDSMLLELEKVKKISHTDKETIVTELTKKQKDIFAKLSLCS